MEIQETIRAEGEDAQRRYDSIIQIGREHLQFSALIEEKPFSREDVEKVREFFKASAPLAHPKVFPSFWETSLLTSIYMRKLAEIAHVSSFDPQKAETLGLLDDLGRLPVPHRYARTNSVGRRLALRIGIREELLMELFSIPRVLGIHHPFEGLGDVSITSRIHDVSNNLGKRNEKGELFTVRDIGKHGESQPGRYPGHDWPSERVGREALTGGGKQEFATRLVLEEIRWFEKECGIDFERLREEVFLEFQRPENQEWLLDVKNARESLDPKVGEVLQMPQIRKIVFDAGGVLLDASDQDLFEKIAADTGKIPQEVAEAIENLRDEGMMGALPEEEFLRKFFSALNIPFPGIEEARKSFIHPEIYKPMEGMEQLVAKTLANQDLEVYVLSDAILPLANSVIDAIRRLYPQIKPQNILISSLIGASKRAPHAPAFGKLLKHIGEEDPQSILFIDDNENYTIKARALHNIRSITFRGNPFIRLSPSQRLRNELERGNLI